MTNLLRPGLLGYPSGNPIIFAQQRRQLAAYIIQDVLAAAGRRVVINAGAVRIRDRLIVFDTRVRRTLSKAIYGLTFPRIRRGKFFHYTGIEAFAEIAKRNELRLYSLRRRMGNPFEGELLNLARLEGWEGLEAANDDPANPDPPGSNLFYTSLTTAGKLWDFGSVRLRLHVSTVGKIAQLREMQYHSPSDVTLLGKINAALAGKELPPILPESSYRMAAYSVPDWLRSETETRLLYLHLDEQRGRPMTDGESDYWPVRFGIADDVADVTLTGIGVNSQRALDQVRKAIAGTPINSIVPTLIAAPGGPRAMTAHRQA
jgi:hypothetical protein